MSINYYLVKLFIVFLSTSFVSAQCPYFTDPKGSCVEDCAVTQFKDSNNKKCLSLASECNGVIYQSRNLCIRECPKGTTLGYNKNLKMNVCIDYDVASLYPKSFDLKCTDGQFKDLSSNSCISMNLCKTRAIIELNVCINECPKIKFVEQSYEIVSGSKIMICAPETYKQYTPNTCLNPKVIDRVNNDCLFNSDECSGYYIEQALVCTVSCGSNEKIKLIEKNGKKVCVNCQYQDISGNCFAQCPSGTTLDKTRLLCLDPKLICQSTETLDLVTRACLGTTSYCKYYYVKATNTCQSACPQYHIIQESQVAQSTMIIKTCIPCRYKDSKGTCYEKCPSNYTIDETKSLCVEPPCISPKVKDLTTNTCLDGPEFCKAYFVKATLTCQAQCPEKHTVVESNFSQGIVKTCNPCQFKDSKGYCYEKCPIDYTVDDVKGLCIEPGCNSPKVKDLTTNKCLDGPEQCKAYFVKATLTCQAQCPEKHTVVESNFSQGIVKTCNPCYFKDSKGYCYEKFPIDYTVDDVKGLCIEPSCNPPKVKDLTTNKCLDGPEQCKAYFVKATSTCQAQCPERHSVVESQFLQSVVKTCIPCYFKDIKGNCYEKCPTQFTTDSNKGLCIEPCNSPKVKDLTTNTCLDGPEFCKAYFVKATLTCQAQCPEKHTVVESNFSQGIVKTCNPCQFKDIKGNCYEKCPSGYTIDNAKSLCIEPCNPPKIKNLLNNECLDGPEQCKQFFVKAISTCQSACPDKHITKEQNFGNSIVAVCIPCFFKDVKGNCYEKCPLPLVADTVKNLCIEQVCVSPQVKDVSTGYCLQNIELCKFFYLRSENQCVQQCPSGYTIQEVQKANFKICIPCNFKDLKGACYEKCPETLIADPTNKQCVEPTKPVLNCKSPQIRDLVNNICLDSPAQCKYYFVKAQLTCQEKCPELHIVQEANFGNNSIVKVCNPCYFKDEKGNCYEQCPSTMRVDKEKRLCIFDPILSCTGYYVKTTGECLNTCPFGFQAIDTTQPRTCIPCDSCSKPEQCTKKLSSDKKSCKDECPIFEIPQPQVSGQVYIQCQKCPSEKYVVNKEGNSCWQECKSEELVNPTNRRCINRVECYGFSYSEGLLNICGKQCPSNQVSQSVPNYKYQQCVPCKTGEFVDTATNKCISQCKLYDSNGITCLNDIKECKGFLNKERTLCLKECPANQFYIQNSSIQNQCIEKCPTDYYSFGQLCTLRCPSNTFGDQTTRSCQKLIYCKYFISFDGQSCVNSCPQGQFPQAGDQNLRYCKVCNLRLSSNGQTCGNECGPSDVFDIDLKQCLDSTSPNTCYNKIYSTNKKECSSKCPSGQILQTNTDGSLICLKNIEECKDYISSDFTQCVKACYGDMEAAIQKGTSKICIKCPYGPNSAKTACSSYQQCDSATQKFDLDLQQCVPSESCKSKYTSTDGKKCSTKCVYPDVSRITSSSQCFQNCETNEIYVKEKGCVAPDTCSNYVASDGKTCIEQCIYIKEAIDETAQNPKRCKKCKDTEISVVIESNNSKIIQCQPQIKDTTENTKKQAESLKNVLDYVPKIQPEQKNNIQQIIVNVASTIESQIKSTDKNLDMTEEQRKAEISNLIQKIRDVANAFVQKIEKPSVDTDTQISLGQSEFQIVAEKKKDGLAFKVSFTVKEFFGATTTSLQTDPSQQSAATLTKTTNTKIETLSAVNIASNPYCTNKDKCSPTGLFTVDYTMTTGKRMLATDDDKPTFQLTYDVDSSKINKSVCVSFDEQTGNIMPAVQTSSNPSANQVTCTFLKNSDLYYDSECQFIDKSQCAIKTNPDSPFDDISVTFGNRVFFSIATLLIMLFQIL